NCELSFWQTGKREDQPKPPDASPAFAGPALGALRSVLPEAFALCSRPPGGGGEPRRAAGNPLFRRRPFCFILPDRRLHEIAWSSWPQVAWLGGPQAGSRGHDNSH